MVGVHWLVDPQFVTTLVDTDTTVDVAVICAGHDVEGHSGVSVWTKVVPGRVSVLAPPGGHCEVIVWIEVVPGKVSVLMLPVGQLVGFSGGQEPGILTVVVVVTAGGTGGQLVPPPGVQEPGILLRSQRENVHCGMMLSTLGSRRA